MKFRAHQCSRWEHVRLIIWWLVTTWGFSPELQPCALAQETRPGASTAKYHTGCDTDIDSNCSQGPQPRIVGGDNADEGRYPYFVSLLNQYGIHSCGGTLVAPDVVICAAHCADSVKYAQVGRWNRAESDDDYEEFDVVTPLYLHPLYESGTSFSHDIMLIKLNRQSTKEYLRINEDPNLPTEQQLDELTALGIGYTQHANASSAPQVLQEASLTYVPNYICESSKDPTIVENYQGLISEDMLCASDDGEDACQGDSGGPLILNRGAGMDLLVGVVSWGFGCANPSFPGVYSRVSYHAEWIKATLCEISNNSPVEYDCANIALPSDEDSVPVTIIIQFDDHPGEVAWSLTRKETETVLASVAAGMYTGSSQSSAKETVFLTPGSNIVFKIEDQYGDGLCCDPPGNYMVVLGRSSDGQVLVSGGGDFGHEKSHDFQVPSDFIDDEEKPELSEGEIPLTVVVQLDGFPQDVGWRVDRLDVQIEEVIRIPAGIYSTPGMKVIRTVILQHDELYNFHLYDMAQNGIKNGYVRLVLGTTDIHDSSRMIFESDGNIEAGVDHTFIASFGNVTTSTPLISSDVYITLQLRMDLYPSEISAQLRMDVDETSTSRQVDRQDPIIFFRPPGYYADRVNEVVTERIAIPITTPGSTRKFSFIIADRYGDGLCCTSKGELDTGYSIYEGDPSEDSLIVTSKFEQSWREVKVFNVEGNVTDETELDTQDPSESNVVVKVTISLDVYPDETGFYVEDSTRRRIIDVPPGTYSEKNSIITEVVTLEAGLYTFTILDVFGDGLNRADGFYKLEVVSGVSHPPLLSGTGAFASRESQTFLLEGDSAQYPLSMFIPIGTQPQNFGFSVFRLDLIETDALIASRGRGSFESANEQAREDLEITEGGLYRIVFEDTGDGVDGEIRIALGSTDPNSFDFIEHTINPSNTSNSQRSQAKFFAGMPTRLSETSENIIILTLRVRFDRFPSEIEWILLANHNFDSNSYSRTQMQREVVTFGPQTLYSPDLENTWYEETIIIPEHSGNKSFTLIVSDSGNDGLCCFFGNGGPLELYQGNSDDGILLFSDPFQDEDRLVANFYLVGSASSTHASCIWQFGLTVLLLGLITIL